MTAAEPAPKAGDDLRPLQIVRQNGFAITATVLSSLAFLANDTMIKLASDTLSISQVIVVRGVFATLLLLAASAVTGQFRSIVRIRDRKVLARAMFEVAGTYFFLIGLFHMPIANVTTIFQSMPFMMTIMAVVFLGEKVGVRRWTAIAVGFAGVILVMRPDTGGFNIYALSVILAAVTIAARDILTRKLDSDIPSIVIAFATSLAVTLSGFVAAPFEDWAPLTATDIAWLGLASICLISGYFLIVASIRAGEISVLAPFRYTIIVFALLSGYLIWGDVPDPLSAVGILLIAGSGIFVFVRERRLGRRIALRPRWGRGSGV